MPAVFDGVVRATIQVTSDLRPVVPVDTVLPHDDQILLLGPLPAVDVRVEDVVVALPALLPAASADVSGELVPVRSAICLHRLKELRVLLARPGQFLVGLQFSTLFV